MVTLYSLHKVNRIRPFLYLYYFSFQCYLQVSNAFINTLLLPEILNGCNNISSSTRTCHYRATAFITDLIMWISLASSLPNFAFSHTTILASHPNLSFLLDKQVIINNNNHLLYFSFFS